MSNDPWEEVHRSVKNARALLLRALRDGPPWRCRCCGSLVENEGDGLWTAHMLCEAAGVDGPVAHIAIQELLRDGAVVADSRWRLRLASALAEEPAS
jgi:hypothetical protein